jgi:hypothetical protein
MLADEHARRAGVVEVDVREQQVADVRQHEPAFGELGLEREDVGRRPAILEREPVLGLEQVDADHALRVFVVQIQRIRRARRHAPDPRSRS